MKLKLTTLFCLVFFLSLGIIFQIWFAKPKSEVLQAQAKKEIYWFELHRRSNKEYLYFGVPNDKTDSSLLKEFVVKSGIPEERPTPLPKLLNKDYWLITKKESSEDNPETAPYFLTLNIPAPSDFPYGPTPYTECGGMQCDWILPGAFGLHGVNGDNTRLDVENPGSSGCIRHSDADITYLYNLLDPGKEEIRYYIVDI